ncbi:MAG: hypothetical protein AAGG51_29030 [Cyanobacteria bacterium P01_G01_bin.54]
MSSFADRAVDIRLLLLGRRASSAIALWVVPGVILLVMGQPTVAQDVSPMPLALTKTKAQATIVQTPAQTPTQTPSYPPLHRQGSEHQPFQPELLPLQADGPRYAAAPGVTVITPSAYGASQGTVSLGLGFQARTRFTEQADGVLGIKLGLGEPQKHIGAEVGLVFVDLDDPGEGFLTLKLHKQLPGQLNLAVGVTGAGSFGETDAGTSVYGVLTQRITLAADPQQAWSQLDLSLGLGNGQFRSEDQVQRDEEAVGIFGAAAVRVTEPLSAIAEWTGQDLTLGFSWVPFAEIPLVITPALTDLTGNAGDGTRFILGASYSAEF